MTNPILKKIYDSIPETNGVKFLGSFYGTDISENSSKEDLLAMIEHFRREDIQNKKDHEEQRRQLYEIIANSTPKNKKSSWLGWLFNA